MYNGTVLVVGRWGGKTAVTADDDLVMLMTTLFPAHVDLDLLDAGLLVKYRPLCSGQLYLTPVGKNKTNKPQKTRF